MSWSSQLFFAILIAIVTGTIAKLFWEAARVWIAGRNPKLAYQLLRIVCILYIFPFAYIAIQLTVRDGYIQTDGIWQLNFMATDIVNLLLGAAGLVWIGLSLKCLGQYALQSMRWNRQFWDSIPVEDETALVEFARVKKKLGMHRKVGLYYSPKITSPMVIGFFRFRILLPMRSYSEEQLRVVFYHELTHCKRFDIFYKVCSVYIGMLQNLSGHANQMLEELEYWGECSCDIRAVEAMSDEIPAKRYFEVILEIMGNRPRMRENNHIFSKLYENQLTLERRIEYMKKYMSISRLAKRASFLLAFGVAMVSVSTAYAAGAKLAEVHDNVYKGMEVTIEETMADAGLEEHVLYPEDDDTYDRIVYANPELEEIIPLLDANEMASFNWTVTPGTRHVSSKFYVKSGQSIAISATAIPAGQTFWIGIMDSSGVVRYVEGTGALSHTFSISDSGNYRVLVQNRGTKNITASGSYYFY